MAERLEHLPQRNGRPSLYPWAEWMNGDAWRIRRGVDFDVSPNSIAQLIRERGRRYGVAVSAWTVDHDGVEFQFAAPAPESAAA